MAINYSESDSVGSPVQSRVEQYTVIGLFEDRIDARQALAALLRTNAPSNAISIAFREREAANGRSRAQSSEVIQALTEAELEGISRALVGLAAVIVPGRGRFLVAGPIGAMLASLTYDDQPADPRNPSSEAVQPSPLLNVFTSFGINQDESMYIESRLVAGAELLALSTDSPELVPVIRRKFADDNAVFITGVRTDERVIREMEEILESPPEIYKESDVVVTDAVAGLRSLLNADTVERWAADLGGALVIDPHGDEVGTIEDLLIEADGHDQRLSTRERLRYVVIGFGGLLGIGRHYTIVPADQVALDATPIEVAFDKDVLHRAPAYDSGTPLSRREERAVCAYYGLEPYWAVNQE